MSNWKESGRGLSPPDDSLSNYFDELLGGYDVVKQVSNPFTEQPLPVAASVGRSRVVVLPTQKDREEKPNKTDLKAERTRIPALQPVARFVDPDPAQSLEQKRKLEKLLQSARPQLLVESAASIETRPDTKTAFVSDPNEIQEWDLDPVIDVPAGTAPPSTENNLQTSHFEIEGLQWLENGRPQWAQSSFDVLLFTVSGLTLAVPLISLGQIQPLTEKLTPLFGQAAWFMGFQPTPSGKIRTVNTAMFVMPERYDATFLETAKYVMSISGVPWGLAVDTVNQPITLMPSDVKWRGDRSKRPWLAGTVKNHMCALLDIPRIGQILIDTDKNFRP